ncbi:2Fe-2S iron-sulfur cluster-binding protein [Aneurinibacillus uraniidurans]|uniref:2Fe-2S iron-sulfur cluster-binding protein n=1 Tax=Aneurinibacillus uraniidurans TaxID=2966586 RepID=UPI00234BB49E|nr:2Fe-2S iron-sulfur cluster-binding protein [Aneurinibacillus sp. B1]WCN39511.1 2Fe-2S iron-sulfur cluster-binding protein [Aneurinibacillus sp. B1]
MNTYNMYVRGQDKEIKASAQRTLLDAAAAARLPLLVGCKGGGCGVCKVRVVDGTIEHGFYSKSVLTDEERSVGYVLACQAKPLSDVTIDLCK